MSKVSLTREQHKQLVRFIAERARILTALDRQTLLKQAGLGRFLTRLHFDSAARSFSLELVDDLQNYGTLDESGQPALVSLLRELREEIGGGAEADFLDQLLAPYSDTPPLDRSTAVRILYLSANPRETSKLEIEREIVLILQRLRESERQGRFDLEPGLAVSYSDLSRLLLAYQPHIVQVTGHGAESGEILLEDGRGEYQPVDPALLVDLFRILKGHIRCVLLCVCWSAPLAETLAEHIPAVIGMDGPLDDEAGRHFAGGFYRGVVFGEPLQRAFELGCNELALIVPRDKTMPKLFTRPGVDPAQFYLRAE